MTYILDENSLSLEDFILLIENEENINFSEKLLNKITLSSNLLDTYEDEIDNYLLNPIYKSYDSCEFISPKEVRGILLSLIYTSANSNSGIRKKTLDELCQYLNQQFLIPEHTLSLKINTQSPYYYIIKYLKNISNIEKKIILQSPGYLIGIACIYFPEIELVRKLLTLVSVLTLQINHINPYNLAYTPLIPFIKLSENINLLLNYDKNANSHINSEIFVRLSEVYKFSSDLKEALNIQLNSSQFPIIFIPEKNIYIYNTLLNSQKLYLTKNIDDLLNKIDNTFLIILSKFNKRNNTIYPINNIICKLKNNLLGEPILNLRKKIRVYKEALSIFLYISSHTEDSKLKTIIKEFFKQKNISNYLEIKYHLKEFLSFIEIRTNELF